MKDKQQKSGQMPTDADQLRKQAEQQAKISDPGSKAAQTPEEIQRLLHELQVHQIELEMQNEEVLRTQSALETSHQEYFDLYNFAPAGYCTLSKQGLILEANLTMTTLLGTPRSALITLPFSRFILKEDQDIYYLHRKQLLEGGEPRSCDLRMMKMDGTIFWVILSATIAHTEADTQVFRVILSDITSRKQAEQERDELLTRLRESQQLAGLGTWEWDLNADKEYWSDELFTIYGRDPKKGVPHPDDFQAQHHPDDRDKVHDAIEQSLSQGVAEIEYRLMRHDDHAERTVSMRCRVENGPDGLPARQIGTIIDITEQKQREEELNHLLSDLNKAQAVSHVGSWHWDIQANRLTWSDEMYRIFGINHDKFSGDLQDVIAKTIHPDDIPAVEASNRSVIEKGQPIPVEYRIIRPDGDIRTVWAEAGQLVKDKNGKPAYLTGIVIDITERKKAENVLHASEARFRAIFEQAAVGVCMVGKDAVFIEINEKFCQITGYIPEELRQMTVMDITHPDDMELDQSYIQKVLAGEIDTYQIEKRYIHKDGRTVWIILFSNVVRDLQGQVGYAIAAVEDITARKQLEMQRDQLTTQLQDAQRIAHLGSWEWDLRTNQEIWSQELFRIYGIDPQGGVPPFDSHYDHIHLDDHQLVQDASLRAQEEGRFDIEYRVIRQDNGTVRWVHATMEIVYGSDKEALKNIGTVIDITERKQAEIALARSQQQYTSLVEDSPMLISRWQPDGTLTFANRAYCEFFGKSQGELIGTKIYAEIPEDDLETVKQFISRVSPKYPVQTGENRAIRHDGQARWMRWTDRAFFDAEGNISHYQSFGTDIHERRNAEEVRGRLLFAMQEAQRIAQIGSWEWDIPNDIYYWSDELFHIYGRNPQDGVPAGEEHVAVIHPDDLAAMRAAKIESLVTGTYACEYRLFRFDNGEERIVNALGEVEFDQDGKPIVQRGTLQDVTDMRKREAALHESQQRYQSVVDDSPVLISRFQPDGTISFTNSAYSQFFIGEDEAMVGENIFQFILPGHHASAREYLASFTPEEPIQKYDDQLKRHDGAARWLRWTDRAFFDEKGNITEYQAFGEDITRQKESELALQASEQRYQSVVEDAPLMIIRYLPDGTITFTNSQYRQFYTGANDGLPWATIYDKYTPAEQRRVKKDLETLSPANPIRNLEGLCDRFDGQQRWVRWKDVALFDGQGNLTSYQAFGEDIHDQYLAELKQKEAERDLKALMANLPGMAYRADAHGRFKFQFLSQGCKQLTGYDSHVFLDEPDFNYEMIMGEEYKEPLIEQIKFAVEHNTPFEITYRIITKSGEEKWVWERGSVVLDEASKPHHIEGFITDITRTKELQEELRKSEDLLNTSQRLSQSGGWEWHVASQTMYWTDETYRIHDLAPGEIEPGLAEHVERSSQCYHPQDRPVILAAFQRCMEDGQPYDLEFPFTTFKGRQLWIRTTGQPTYKDKKMVSVIGTISDITAQKLAQEHVLEKARFEQLLASISKDMLEVGISQIDARIEDALKQVGKLLDLDRISVSHIIDEDTMVINHTWSRKKIKGTRAEYRLADYPWLFSTLTDGKIKNWTISEGIPSFLTDAEKQLIINGAIQSFLGIPVQYAGNRKGGIAFSDTGHADRFTPEMVESLHLFSQIISNAISLRDIRHKVTESEARFRAFMDNFPANVYIKDAQGKYIFINQDTSNFAGITKEEYIGKKTSDIYPAPLASELDLLDQSVIHDQIIIEKEGYFTSPKGEKRYQRDIKFPIHGLYGEKLVGGIALDLTAQKLAQERVLEKARFEQLLAQISTAFLNMDPGHIDDGITNALKEIGVFLDIDRVVVSHVEQGQISRLTHIWSEKVLKGVRNSYDIQNYPWLFSTSVDGKTVIWSANDGLPDHVTNTERDFFRISAVQSLVSLPIQSAGSTIGSIIFSDYEDTHKFTPELVESLHLFAQIISNALTLRNAQREIRESAARYRSVVEDAPVLINRYKPDGTIVFANQAYCHFMGKELPEIIGMKFYESMPGDARQGAKERLKNISADNPFYIVESKLLSADGQERWIRWTVRSLLNSQGEIDVVQSFGIDITNQRLATERIAASERQFRSLFSEMANGFALFEIVKNKKGEPVNIAFVEVNPAFEQVTGLLQEDITGKAITEVLPDFDQGWLQDYIDVALHGLTFERKDFNERLGIYTDIRAFSPHHGQCAVLLSDITEQETLYRQIALERNRTQYYLDTVQSIMIAMDSDGNLTLANPKACEILGFKEEELLGKNWFETCLPEENIAEIKGVFQKIVLGEMESVKYYENKIRTRTGEELIIAWHNAVMKDRDGNFLGVLSSGEDINARKAAEQRFQTLFDISSRLIAASYDQDTLQVVAKEILEKIQSAQAVSVWIYDQQKEKLAIEAIAGFEDDRILGLTVNKGEGVVGQVAKTKQPMLVHHANIHPAFSSIGNVTAEMSEIQCMICVPLIFQGKLLGAISIDNLQAPEAFDMGDLSLVESIANQLAGTVENALLFEQLQQSQDELRALSQRLLEVHETERRAVALDLHDHFGQILTTFKLSLRPEAFINHSEEEQRTRLAEVTAIVDEMIEAAEDLSLRLRPSILDDLGLTLAFEWHIQRFARQANIPIHSHIQIEKGKRFSTNTEITLYRVLEESLSNALRHGNPETIAVDLCERGDSIMLTVRDDGSGFSEEEAENKDPSQTGLIGMQERVRLLNGVMHIDTVPGKGTTIEIKIPIIAEGKNIDMDKTP